MKFFVNLLPTRGIGIKIFWFKSKKFVSVALLVRELNIGFKEEK